MCTIQSDTHHLHIQKYIFDNSMCDTNIFNTSTDKRVEWKKEIVKQPLQQQQQQAGEEEEEEEKKTKMKYR